MNIFGDGVFLEVTTDTEVKIRYISIKTRQV